MNINISINEDVKSNDNDDSIDKTNNNDKKYKFHYGNYDRRDTVYLLIDKNNDIVRKLTAYDIKKEFGINDLRLFLASYGPTPVLGGCLLIEDDMTKNRFKTFCETNEDIYYIGRNGKFLRYHKDDMERENIEPEYSAKLNAYYTVIEGKFYVNAYETAKAFGLIDNCTEINDVKFIYMDDDKRNCSVSNIIPKIRK